MAYIGNGPGVASQRILTTLTATEGQTSFTPSAGYTLGYVDVFLNGVKLIDGTDYAAADGVSIVLTEAATLDDTVEVVAYFPRGLSDGYTKAEADGRYEPLDSAYTKAEADARYIAQGTPTGGGMFKGENGTVGTQSGDIFRINEQTLNTNVTIDAAENASCAGPLTLATGVTLTVNGNLTVV